MSQNAARPSFYMKSGIYHVQFSSSSRAAGEGLAVFKDGAVNGGDIGYVYTGTFTAENGTFLSHLQIKKWNPNVVSVFGPIPDFVLDLTGTFAADLSTFTAGGGIRQLPGLAITIRGRRIADAT